MAGWQQIKYNQSMNTTMHSKQMFNVVMFIELRIIQKWIINLDISNIIL